MMYMKYMKALLVPVEKVEPVRKTLLGSGYLATGRRLIRRGDYFEIPVIDENVPGFESFPVVCQQHVEYYESGAGLRDLLKRYLDTEKLNMLPKGWQILGYVIIISLKRELYSVRAQIGHALLQVYLHCKSVFLDEGIKGELRKPKRELIAVRDGVEDPGTTVHIENGCRFKMDVRKVMFSKGNLEERIRMSRLGSGEVVVDMFAGIGYFTIPMVVCSRPKKIVAIELNPESYHYLIENIRLNHGEYIVEPVLGDCAKKTPISTADRVIMGYVKCTHYYLINGILALKPGGVLHYHETVPICLTPARPIDRIKAAAGSLGRETEVISWHRVKKYSPGVWHVVIDARIY
jgi:tRNA wybutosine-synthesizing protein 2